MYQDPGALLAFGDVITADWLFDVYVRQDSSAIFDTGAQGGGKVYSRRPDPPRKEDHLVLASITADLSIDVLVVGTRRMAIVLTGDCEIASLAGQREGAWEPRGRILCASLHVDDPERIEQHIAPRQFDLGRHPMLPDASRGFSGGFVDFNRVFSVQTKSLVGQSAAPDLRVMLSQDRDGKELLAQRWAGHILRQGPIAARIALGKFARLLASGGDRDKHAAMVMNGAAATDPDIAAAKAIWETLESAWFLGGPLLQDVEDAEERLLGQDQAQGMPDVAAINADIMAALVTVRDSAAAAIEALQERAGRAA